MLPRNCLIIANGPSSKLINFASVRHRYDAINSMNASFRTWIKTDFRPTHFTALDSVLTQSLADDINFLIQEKKIAAFFLNDSFLKKYPEHEKHPRLLFLSHARRLFEKHGNASLPITTGTWAIRWMLQQDFRTLDVIGMDGIRIEQIPESLAIAEPENPNNTDELKISVTPAFNPNYYSSSYQQEGDRYRVPNAYRHLKQNHIKLHDHALLAVLDDIPKHFPGVTLNDFSTNSFNQILRKSSFRLRNENGPEDAATDGSSNISRAEMGTRRKHNKFFLLYADLINLAALNSRADSTFFLGPPCHVNKEADLTQEIFQFIASMEHGIHYADRPTIPIIITDRKADPRLTSAEILNGIRHKAIFEWEVYGEPRVNILEAIDLLSVNDRAQKALRFYPGNIYCDFTQNAESSEASASLRIALKDYLFGSADHPENMRARRLSDFARIAGQTLALSVLVQDHTNIISNQSLEYKASAEQPLTFLLNHRYLLDVKVACIKFAFLTPPNLQFKANIQSFSKLSTFQRGPDKKFSSDPSGRLTVNVRLDYSSRHIGTVINISPITQETTSVECAPNSATVLLINDTGQSFSKVFLFWRSATLPLKLLQNEPDARPVGGPKGVKRLILIEPDFADRQGHFHAYARNLYKTVKRSGLDFSVLANRNINSNPEIDLPRRIIQPAFSKNTWAIATARDTFRVELEQALEGIQFDPKDDLLYMYSGSVFHALELQRLAQSYSCSATCTLFWEMVKDIRTTDYQSAFSELKERMALADCRLALLAPTQQVADFGKRMLGVALSLAPHPSTSVHELDMRGGTPPLLTHSGPLNGHRAPHLFFPGVNTIHKGYEFGIKLALHLSKLGYACSVRDVETEMEKHPLLTYIPLALSEDAMNELFRASDLIVVPYLPEGFGSRTSGLAVDALLHSRPLAALRETWLAGHINDYHAGVIIDPDVGIAAKQIVGYLDNFDADRFHGLELASKEYVENNSWASLLEMIVPELVQCQNCD